MFRKLAQIILQVWTYETCSGQTGHTGHHQQDQHVILTCTLLYNWRESEGNLVHNYSTTKDIHVILQRFKSVYIILDID